MGLCTGLKVGRAGRAADSRGGRAVVLVVIVWGLSTVAGAQATPRNEDLPDAPSAQIVDAPGQDGEPSTSAASQGAALASAGEAEGHAGGGISPAISRLRPCNVDYPPANMPLQGPPPCLPENPVEPIVTSVNVQPLSSQQKGLLAMKDFLDPFNFVSIAGYSAIAVAWNSHSAYGAGFEGWAKLTGYGLAEDAQGEFFQTYAIPSLVHEDPRYHRMPDASVKRRIWHAIEHTYVSQHDDGRPMPNYATLLTYPISAELSNLYVPGIPTNGPATARRVAIGIATDPAGSLVAEFLPDIAKHIHIHAQFAQELIDRAMTGSPTTTAQ